MRERWTIEQANEWYLKQGWLRGCNFIGSDCANRLDMFQSYKSEEKLKTAERELALAQKIGFNTVRIWANFDVYYAEPESYMEIFERYIELCSKYNQKVMVVLTHEEDLPRGDVFVPKPMGEQKYALGYHQGRFPLTEEEASTPIRHYYEYPDVRPVFLEFIRKTINKYKNDERILCWNLYNEPSHGLSDDRSGEILDAVYNIAREEDPIQPLTVDLWRGFVDGRPKTAEQQRALEMSDVISFHSYESYERLVEDIDILKRENRPLLLTEWLHRVKHNNVFDIYPLLYITNVANYCWGFVAGKTQTTEPWEDIWQKWNEGIDWGFDFTKWQHDLFRPNLRPYDPREIKLIEKFNKLAADGDR